MIAVDLHGETADLHYVGIVSSKSCFCSSLLDRFKILCLQTKFNRSGKYIYDVII